MREAARSDVQTFPERLAEMGADEGMERAERLHRLYGLLESLPPRQREVLKLVYAMDLSIAEVARRLGVSRGTALNHHARALKTLAQQIQRDSGRQQK
jgi:RNA polymerase sigma-70 factor (ECF subfamily)